MSETNIITKEKKMNTIDAICTGINVKILKNEKFEV